MFSTKKSKPGYSTDIHYPGENDKTVNAVSIIGSGTTLRGDIKSNGDLRIEGTIIGNIRSSSKVVIGPSGLIEGDITAHQADIAGKVTGNIRVKDLLQLKGDSSVTGNLRAAKLQVEPTISFTGQ